MPAVTTGPINAYFKAANAHDTDEFLALLTPNAVVTDQGIPYRGTEIQAWDEEMIAKYHSIYEVTEVVEGDQETVATVTVTGDFEGSPAALHFRFVLEGDKISAMTLEP